MSVDLYPHQEDALERLHNGSILWGAVGTGKSLVAAAYYVKNEAPKNVYVITTAKKRDSLDWQTEFARYGIGTKPDATVGGVLTVDSWNNIGRYRHVTDAFFIFDEQRLVGSGEWVGNFLSLAKSNSWILLSATPGDTWLDYIPVFVANGFFKNRTEFKRDHVVYKPYAKFPKVERYTSVGRLVRLRNQILVEMPYRSHTVRHSHDIPVEYSRSLFDRVVKRKWHIFEHRPLRDVAELFIVMRKTVNSDPSRLEAVRALLEKHPKLIIFYNFDFELMTLRSLSQFGVAEEWSEKWQTRQPVSITSSGSKFEKDTELDRITTASVVDQKSPESYPEHTPMILNTIPGSSFQVAEWNGHKHEPIPKTDSWVYLVQYAAGAEGWNCIETDAMLFYSLPYSYKLFEQAHGRIDRLNTPFTLLHYYSLVSDSVIDKAIQRCLAQKRSFNESQQTWAK